MLADRSDLLSLFSTDFLPFLPLFHGGLSMFRLRLWSRFKTRPDWGWTPPNTHSKSSFDCSCNELCANAAPIIRKLKPLSNVKYLGLPRFLASQSPINKNYIVDFSIVSILATSIGRPKRWASLVLSGPEQFREPLFHLLYWWYRIHILFFRHHSNQG